MLKPNAIEYDCAIIILKIVKTAIRQQPEAVH